jgi:hypothetical protein
MSRQSHGARLQIENLRCLTMIAMCLVTRAGARGVVAIAVAVVAPRDVTDSLVNRICAEAEAIWAPAGIALEWNRDASKDEARRLVIEVTIDDRPAPVGRDGALGWLTFTRDSPDRFIHLSRASAEVCFAIAGLNDTITTEVHWTRWSHLHRAGPLHPPIEGSYPRGLMRD